MQQIRLPRVSFDSTPAKALDAMRANDVSGVVAVDKGRRFRLYLLPEVLKAVRDHKPSLAKIRGGRTVHPLSLRDIHEFRLDVRDPDRSYNAFEYMLDRRGRSYAAVNLEWQAENGDEYVVIVTRHETEGIEAENKPRWCTCSRDARHVWNYREDRKGQACEYGDGGQVTCN